MKKGKEQELQENQSEGRGATRRREKVRKKTLSTSTGTAPTNLSAPLFCLRDPLSPFNDDCSGDAKKMRAIALVLQGTFF